MPRRTKADTERTYESLLDSAAKLFIRHGVAKTTLNTIATEAGMTRGAIYHHFENKDAVIQALWERNGVKFQQALNDLVVEADSETPAASFRQAIKDLLQLVTNDPELGQMMRIIVHNVEFTDEHTPLQLYLMEQKKDFVANFQQAFENLKKNEALKIDLPAALLTLSLMSYIYGLVHEQLLPFGAGFDLRKDGDVLTDLFLDGILVE